MEQKTEEEIEEKILEEIYDEKGIDEVETPVLEEVKEKVKSYEEVFNALKEYRLNKSREEKVKPYFIYNNEMMEEIIKLKPKTKEELISIKGLGPVKIEKYGQDIVDIIRG